MPLGAFVALKRDTIISARLRHGITAFGGGALISAVALVLVPDGAAAVGGVAAVLCFLGGGVLFFGVDRALETNGGTGAQLLAMLLDYAPEAAALGAFLAVDFETSLLLAGLIFLQNLPEGYSAFNEISAARKQPAARIVALFAALALVGPGAAAIGVLYLSEMPAVLGGIMLAAAGGILYLVFQDIAPQARTTDDWVPPLGAVAGFGLGLAGHLALG
ncbi:divalent cation transporter [Cognatishimia sp. F0-27]|nr:divalent cation transporter [Cognatishimia sp. F0-27]